MRAGMLRQQGQRIDSAAEVYLPDEVQQLYRRCECDFKRAMARKLITVLNQKYYGKT